MAVIEGYSSSKNKMTAIITFNYNKSPYILSDLLLSGLEQPGNDIHIPPLEDIAEIFPRGSGFTVTGLTQKVAIIDDHMAIGFSGHYIAAKALVKEIEIHSKKKKFDPDTICAFLDNEIPDYQVSGEQLTVVGHLFDIGDNGRLCHFGYGCSMLPNQHPVFGDVRFIGSGGENLWKRLQHLNSTIQTKSLKDLGSSYPFLPLSILIDSITEELVSPNQILNFYGGGWEIVQPAPNGFTKIENATLVFWRIDLDNNETKISNPLILFNYKYRDGILYIRRVWFKDFNSNEYDTADNLFVIGSLSSRKIKNQSFSINVNAPLMINVFIIVENNKLKNYRIDVRCGSDSADLTEFIDSENGISEIKVNGSIVNDILNEALNG